jgi:CubicO group peptidase (beta-lactamase class C family)
MTIGLETKQTEQQRANTMAPETTQAPAFVDPLCSPAGRAHARCRAHIVSALALAAVVALLGVLARPNPPALSTAVTGDAALAARVRPLLIGALDRVSVATVAGDTVTYAGFGADENTVYELGSVSKTFTALLFADAIARGEVSADTRLGALLPLGPAPVADVTLAELASHRSGLPQSGLSGQGLPLRDEVPFDLRYLMHRDPFTQDVAGVVAIARTSTLSNRGGFVYSNLGVALLGHALAAAAHMDFASLVQQRIFTPLGMTASSIPVTIANLPANAPTGYSADGKSEAAWTLNGWAPTGGIRSTPADMVHYARALLDGTAPGMDALTPQWTFGMQTIGYVWMTEPYMGHTVTWKNGESAGFESKITLDRPNHRAAIILSNTAASVDDAANMILIGGE